MILLSISVLKGPVIYYALTKIIDHVTGTICQLSLTCIGCPVPAPELLQNAKAVIHPKDIILQ